MPYLDLDLDLDYKNEIQGILYMKMVRKAGYGSAHTQQSHLVRNEVSEINKEIKNKTNDSKIKQKKNASEYAMNLHTISQ